MAIRIPHPRKENNESRPSLQAPQKNNAFAPPLQQFISKKQTAVLLGVSEKTIGRWIEDQTLLAHKLGRQWRIALDDIEEFLAKRKSWHRTYVS